MTHATPRPSTSPWGPVQHAEAIMDGVWLVSTAGHGGVHVEETLNARIPAPWRSVDGWYEEDEELTIPWVLLDLPRRPYWKADYDPVESLRGSHWKLYEAQFGVTLLPGESWSKDRDTFEAAHAGELVACCALSTCHYPAIGPHQVGVVASPLGSRGQGDRNFLISRERYRALQGESPHGLLITDEFQPADPQFRPLQQP